MKRCTYHATDYYGDRECAPPWAYDARDKEADFDRIFLKAMPIAFVAILFVLYVTGIYAILLP